MLLVTVGLLFLVNREFAISTWAKCFQRIDALRLGLPHGGGLPSSGQCMAARPGAQMDSRMSKSLHVPVT
jgi:hypothetical protein